jgi:RNA polymerase sigma-70 factor, ECF subfamily
VVALYDQLLAITPSAVVALHRAVAVAELDGPQVALALVDGLDLDAYYLTHAVRADLLRRLDRPTEAREAYGRALALTDNEAERAFLQRRRAELPHS